MEEIGYIIKVSNEQEYLYDVDEETFGGIFTDDILDAKFIKQYIVAEAVIKEGLHASSRAGRMEIIKVRRTFEVIE